MTDPVPVDNSATEETGSALVQAPAHPESQKQEPRKFLETARRDLSEDELATPAARRFLIAEIERLDERCSSLRETEKAYNDLRVEHAREQEANKRNKTSEILSFVSTTIGAAGIGAAPSYINVQGLAAVGWVVAFGSAILILVGVIARIFR